MTPEFIGPFEDALEAKGIPFRLVSTLLAVVRSIREATEERLAVYPAASRVH